MLFLEYPKCSTCQKAKKWLDEHQIPYEDRHIVENNPTFEELKDWYEPVSYTHLDVYKRQNENLRLERKMMNWQIKRKR